MFIYVMRVLAVLSCICLMLLVGVALFVDIAILRYIIMYGPSLIACAIAAMLTVAVVVGVDWIKKDLKVVFQMTRQEALAVIVEDINEYGAPHGYIAMLSEASDEFLTTQAMQIRHYSAKEKREFTEIEIEGGTPYEIPPQYLRENDVRLTCPMCGGIGEHKDTCSMSGIML